MSEELITRIRKGLERYRRENNIKSNKKVAAEFLRKMAFSPGNSAFKLVEVNGWSVVSFDTMEDEIIVDRFLEKSEAEERFVELYPNGAEPEAKEFLMYEAPLRYNAWAGKPFGKKSTLLTGLSDSEAREKIVEAGAENFINQITKILDFTRDEEFTGIRNGVNPLSVKDAMKARSDLQEKREKARARKLFRLLEERHGSEELYIKDEKSFLDQNINEKVPKLSVKDIEIKSGTSIGYHQLLEFDRFLSGDHDVSVGLVLCKSHEILAPKFDANPKFRPSLSGPLLKMSNLSIVDGSIKNKMEDEFSLTRRHLKSDLREMVDEMANKGFDVQPIFEDEVGGECIGVVNISDIAGIMADRNFNLDEGMVVGDLNKIKGIEDGFIQPPPVVIDASKDVSVAANILKHGNELILIKFDPENWHRSESEKSEILEILQPGYHIFVAHDLITYRLNYQ